MLKYFFEKIHPKIKSNSRAYWYAREWFVVGTIGVKRLFDRPKKRKKRILFFYIWGLAYGGTSSFMQVLAKYLNKEKYEVFFMYSDQGHQGLEFSQVDSRLQSILERKIFPIPFSYNAVEPTPPYFISGMSPNVFDVLRDFDIDLLVATGAGHADFPFSNVRNIPVILLNIFGQPNVQKNITYHICISQAVADKLPPIVPPEKIAVMFVPSEGPIEASIPAGKHLRAELGIGEHDLVFGRIGRATDDIFDPIGIRAFQRVVKKYPHVHYCIVAPSPALKAIVETEHIPNVHFLPENGTKEGLWAYYYAFDVLAHFRKDGESFGLNIAEAMYAGLPVISHVSRIWNAHLEYLNPSCSFVAEIDNVDQYTYFMEIFAQDTSGEKRRQMGAAAKHIAETRFHISKHIGDFERMVADSLKQTR